MMKMPAMTLAILLMPCATEAQEMPPKRGMVLDEGVWEMPTPATALRVLSAPRDGGGRWPGEPAVAVLRQTFTERPSESLDAFADELVKIMIGDDMEKGTDASLVLLRAASNDNDEGTPYQGTKDALVRAYEALEEQAGPKGMHLLSTLKYGGGIDYVVNLFNTSRVPPECQYRSQVIATNEPLQDVSNPCPNVAVWCDAGRVLLDTEYVTDREAVIERCVAKRH